MTPQRSQSVFESFNYAAEGVIHALRTQRNLWIHFTVAAAVLVATLSLRAVSVAVWSACALASAATRTHARRRIDRLTTTSYRPSPGTLQMCKACAYAEEDVGEVE